MADLADDVIGRASAGDIAAFEEIYRYHAGMVYRVALRMMARVEDAEEVTQQVFISVHKHLKSFNGKSSLKTWLYRITVNCSLNTLKARKRHVEVAWVEGFDPEDTHDNVRETLTRGEIHQQITDLLEEITPDQRACILLRTQEGLSYEEIALTLGINVNTVRSRLKRAREALLTARTRKGVAV